MKFIVLLVLIAFATAETAEECVRSKCAAEVKTCESKALTCGIKALNCSKGTPAENYACAQKSGNADLIKLNECGKANCSGLSAANLFANSCALTCFTQLEQVCALESQSMDCFTKFFTAQPGCVCLLEY